MKKGNNFIIWCYHNTILKTPNRPLNVWETWVLEAILRFSLSETLWSIHIPCIIRMENIQSRSIILMKQILGKRLGKTVCINSKKKKILKDVGFPFAASVWFCIQAYTCTVKMCYPIPVGRIFVILLRVIFLVLWCLFCSLCKSVFTTSLLWLFYDLFFFFLQ